MVLLSFYIGSRVVFVKHYGRQPAAGPSRYRRWTRSFNCPSPRQGLHTSDRLPLFLLRDAMQAQL